MWRLSPSAIGSTIAVGLLAAACAGEQTEAVADSAIVVGADDRVEAAEASQKIRAASSAVALVVSASELEPTGDRLRLRSSPLRDRLGICADERFASQPSAGTGTAFLVAPDLLATASHVVDQQPVETLAFVFGFAVDDTGGARLTFAADDLRTARRVLDKPPGVGGDWALVELDRPVTTREPLRLRTGDEPRSGDGVVVVGHPSGLPIKAAPGRVLFVTPRLLMMDTDTFAGNSGSPVLNAETGNVEGIFVRGGLDYVPTAHGCRRPHIEGEGAFSEHATRIDTVAPYVPH